MRPKSPHSMQRVLLFAALAAVVLGLLCAAWVANVSAATIAIVGVTTATYLGAAELGGRWRDRSRPNDGLSALEQVIEQATNSSQGASGWIDSGNARVDAIAQHVMALHIEVSTHRRGLEYVATHDPLTGLGNRRYLSERLAQALNHIRSHPHISISLMLIDVDGFKLINDGLGHAAGDAALCEIAKRLRALLREGDTLARLGSDEFALLLFNLQAADASSFFGKLQNEISLPLNLDRRVVNLSASAGIAEGVAGMTVHDWQRHADLALVAGKRSGRTRLSVFRDSMQSDAARQLRIEHALRLAIAHDDLTVWFQPMIDGSNGHVLGLEALCRWTHEGDAMSPQEFISLAESAGLISALGRAVLAHTCRDLADLRARHAGLRCSVNLSIGQFLDSDIESDLFAAVDAAGLPIGALRLEITESLVASHESGVVPTMRRLVERGAEFCLDDFGTGFSSLDRLRQLPIKSLKIDRSFVTPLQHGDDVMVRNIFSLSRDLGLDTVAEGVEHEEERRRLCAIGCTVMQGYLLARPMPTAELIKWLEHRVVRG